ncbi:MAG: amidohydrolase [Acidimicrobiales bacterium]|nr:MAG: amidohydrolase [Acidimicrobiales bacterium]
MAALDYQAFDADNHYYEAEDAFIRHVDPKWHKRCMQWADVNGRKRLLVGGKVNRFIPNPTFDPVARPGCLDDYFRGKVAKSNIVEAFGELVPIPDEYRDREARLAVMDRQNLEACFMFPTLGVGMESSLEHDPAAMLVAFDGFNKWVEEDWGLNYKDRIFTAGYVTLADVDWALDQLDWMIEHDVRVVNMRPASVPDGNGGRRSLGHPAHDPFWKKMNQHGITLAMHSGDSGYEFMSDFWGMTDDFEAFRQNALKSLLTYSPISDALASLIAEGVLSEHTNIRVCTIETGSEWVQPLFKKFDKTYRQQKHAFPEDPIEVFRRQVWVSPYYEDDLVDLRDKVGAEHMLFGSDWPHAEGLPEPTDFIHDLHEFDSAEIEKIMRTNGLALTQRAV